MIYLNNTTDLQFVPIPFEAWDSDDLIEAGGGEYYFKATFDNKGVEIFGPGDYGYPEDVSDVSWFGHYWLMGVRLPEGIADGSYELMLGLYLGEDVLTEQTYVVQVGAYHDRQVTEYDKTIEYDQYRN